VFLGRDGEDILKAIVRLGVDIMKRTIEGIHTENASFENGRYLGENIRRNLSRWIED